MKTMENTTFFKKTPVCACFVLMGPIGFYLEVSRSF